MLVIMRLQSPRSQCCSGSRAVEVCEVLDIVRVGFATDFVQIQEESPLPCHRSVNTSL